jgi:hypothetical protein
MRYILNFIILLLVLLGSILAQESDNNDKTKKWGLGLTFIDLYDIYTGAGSYVTPVHPNITIPIFVSSKIKIEPNFGFKSIKNETEQNDPLSHQNRIDSQRHLQIAVGIFPFTKKEKFIIYYGAHLGYIITYTESEIVTEYPDGYVYTDEDIIEGDGFFIAPAIAGEYFFIENFSMACEIQIKYISTQQAENEDRDTRYPRSFSMQGITFRSLFMVRFYF